jgi:hypothetical protein
LLALPLGVIPEQHGRIVADALGDDMHRHSSIKQQRGMGAAEVVKIEITGRSLEAMERWPTWLKATGIVSHPER